MHASMLGAIHPACLQNVGCGQLSGKRNIAGFKIGVGLKYSTDVPKKNYRKVFIPTQYSREYLLRTRKVFFLQNPYFFLSSVYQWEEKIENALI